MSILQGNISKQSWPWSLNSYGSLSLNLSDTLDFLFLMRCRVAFQRFMLLSCYVTNCRLNTESLSARLTARTEEPLPQKDHLHNCQCRQFWGKTACRKQLVRSLRFFLPDANVNRSHGTASLMPGWSILSLKIILCSRERYERTLVR